MATKKEIERLFQKLGAEPRLATFNDRIKFQKIVYLLEHAFKIDLGISFTWYLHGPYSPDLTRIIFDKESGFSSKLNNDPDEINKIENAKSFLKDEIESREKLELLASLHFFLKVTKDENKTVEELLSLFAEVKPKFNKVEIRKYYNKIKPYL